MYKQQHPQHAKIHTMIINIPAICEIPSKSGGGGISEGGISLSCIEVDMICND